MIVATAAIAVLVALVIAQSLYYAHRRTHETDQVIAQVIRMFRAIADTHTPTRPEPESWMPPAEEFVEEPSSPFFFEGGDDGEPLSSPAPPEQVRRSIFARRRAAKRSADDETLTAPPDPDAGVLGV